MNMLRLALCALFLVTALATTGGALPTTCADPCTVLAATPGFVPAVISIESGTSVTWESLDITHPAGEALPSGDPCFIASTTAGFPSPPVAFTWDGATLRANGVACDSAQSLPTGEGMLAYRCLLHATMVGTLVVS